MLHQALLKPPPWDNLWDFVPKPFCRRSKGQQLSNGQYLKVTVRSYWGERELAISAPWSRESLERPFLKGLCDRKAVPDLPTAMTSACWGFRVIRSSRNVTMAEISDDEAGMREVASMAGLPSTFPISPKEEHP